MVTDPTIVAEALRHKSLDKDLPAQFGSQALDEVTITSLHGTREIILRIYSLAVCPAMRC
jgi:hypothetical protein